MAPKTRSQSILMEFTLRKETAIAATHPQALEKYFTKDISPKEEKFTNYCIRWIDRGLFRIQSYIYDGTFLRK